MKIKGRVVNLRSHKRTVFADVFDGLKKYQLMIEIDSYKEPLNKGDFTYVKGSPAQSKTGDEVIIPEYYKVLLRPIKYTGEDYDFGRKVSEKSNLIAIIRDELSQEGFSEVITPTLLSHPGNSGIMPFKTETKEHEESFLRFTLEIELKKICAKTQLPIYEIGNVFRNMGLDRNHPTHEYSIIEGIWPYASLEDGMALCERIFMKAASLIGRNIDEITRKNISSELGSDPHLQQRNYKKDMRLVDEPTFFTNPPSEWSPLSISNPDGTAQDAELIYKKIGLAHTCEEDNNYADIFRKLKTQSDCNGKSMDDIDPEFLAALRYGLPPSTGFCIGIDRMLLTLKMEEDKYE